jgi:hypothetical protein
MTGGQTGGKGEVMGQPVVHFEVIGKDAEKLQTIPPGS